MPAPNTTANLLLPQKSHLLEYQRRIVVVAVVGLFFVKVEVNMVEMFRKGTAIRDSATFLDENMTGNLNVLIKAHSKSGEDGIIQPKNLKDLDKLQTYLNEIDGVTSTISITEVVKSLHTLNTITYL